MRKTIEAARHYIDMTNGCMFYKGQRDKYYFVQSRNGYYALDVYQRCDECKAKAEMGINAICSKDTMYESVGGYKTGNLYDMARTAFKTVEMM